MVKEERKRYHEEEKECEYISTSDCDLVLHHYGAVVCGYIWWICQQVVCTVSYSSHEVTAFHGKGWLIMGGLLDFY